MMQSSDGLEVLRREADALARAVKDGNTRAVLRVLRVIRDAAASPATLPGITTAQARHVVAREAGFAAWEGLEQRLDVEAHSPEDAERALIDAACGGDDAGVEAIATRWPEVVSTSIPCAAALALPETVERLTDTTVNDGFAPRGWPPLLYLCQSAYGRENPQTRANRCRLLRDLLDLGADPNAGTREPHSMRGFRTALGAAIGSARDPALAEALLDAGADIADGPTLYEGSAMWEAVRIRDVDSLRHLLAKEPPQWHVCHALPQALQYDDAALTRLLLEHGGNPNWTMGLWGFDGNCLHEAVVLGNSPEVFAALIEHAAQTEFRDRDGRTPLALATCLNRHDLAGLLREHGAQDDEVRDIDRWVGACFAGDLAAARERMPASLAHRLVPADHLWLCRAVRAGNHAAVRLLLDGGFDPDAMDDDGERPLHLAAVADSAVAADDLIAGGADVAQLNFAGETALDIALAHSDDVVESLARNNAPVSALRDTDFEARFERAADAVADADLVTLKALLAAHPELATARSPRPHRCTLLHYLGANGFEVERQKTPPNAVAAIDFLIESGCDPNAVCYTYRGGPAQTTLGLLTSSSHPREAGLTLAMVSALARGGADLDPVYRLLATIYNEGSLPEGFDPTAESSRHAVVEAAMLAETGILFRLVDAGVDINAEHPDATTALHHAAIDGNAALVEQLLARGADLTRRDKRFNGNAAGWAYAGGHEALGGRLADRVRAAEANEP